MLTLVLPDESWIAQFRPASNPGRGLMSTSKKIAQNGRTVIVPNRTGSLTLDFCSWILSLVLTHGCAGTGDLG